MYCGLVGAGWCWMIWCGVSILVRLHLFGRQSEGDRDFVEEDIVPCVEHRSCNKLTSRTSRGTAQI